jgi:hypothetical protein
VTEGHDQRERTAQKWWNRPLFNGSGPQRRWGWKSILSLIILVFFLDLLAGGNLIQICAMVCFGWIGFVQRVLPEWRWSSSAIISFIVLASALLFGAHIFLRRVYKNFRPDAPAWPYRLTLRFAALVIIIFLTGIATIGVVHQTAWLFRDGIYQHTRPYRAYAEIRRLEQDLAENPATAAQARARLQARLPSWRIIVLPREDSIGAFILSEERMGQRGEVIVAFPRPDQPGRFAPHIKRNTTVGEQLAFATQFIAATTENPPQHVGESLRDEK